MYTHVKVPPACSISYIERADALCSSTCIGYGMCSTLPDKSTNPGQIIDFYATTRAARKWYNVITSFGFSLPLSIAHNNLDRGKRENAALPS